MMKKAGCVLLTIGFLWIGFSFFLSLGNPIGIASDLIRSLPQEQKTFTDKEVHDIIFQGMRMHQERIPWLATPASACLMLIGGLLLNHVASIRERQRRHNSN
jgi:hypothetical protein